MSETPASILLIDDHPLLRQGIKQLISMEQDMEVVGEASNAADGIRMATEIEPDLILMDLNMPEMDGIEALKRLRAQNISSRIIMFTVSDQEEDVVAAL
uniref:response regulator n=1 Tax=uncultured Marinobacter sp. TaxID=187379 RepID=UPI0025910AF1